jgi:fructan beta-fructosidase
MVTGSMWRQPASALYCQRHDDNNKGNRLRAMFQQTHDPHQPSSLRRFQWVAVALAALAASVIMAKVLAATEAPYLEPFRPQFHFTPAAHWMNDPNGMVYANGEYHLFYQYYPYDIKWGPMHWGHALSKDLVHWEHLPIALVPDRIGAIFSGSVVVDQFNTSGFGTRANPPMVAVFSYHDLKREKLPVTDIESQGLAYSRDGGRTWVKYARNPVLKSPGLRDFRDPKVFWHEPSRKWIMTLVATDHVSIYASTDLKHWHHESDFGQGLGDHGGVWECPDLFAMKIAGESGSRYVLLVSVNPGAPNGGSGTQYFVGQFDGHQFKSDTDARWLDRGADNYAGVTWTGVPATDGRRLFLGWMSNWDYAQAVPTEHWRSAMTLPRELTLVRSARGLELHSTSAAELTTLRIREMSLPANRIREAKELLDGSMLNTDLVELSLNLKLDKAGVVNLVFRNQQQEETVFRIDRLAQRFELDRSRSGIVDFSKSFSVLQEAPLNPDDKTLQLHVFLDHSSIEVFVNGGETVFTTLVFPRTPYDSVKLSADEEIDLTSGTVHALKSIWR